MTADAAQPRATTRHRVLVADDHPIVRQGLAAVIATLPDFELVAEATTGREAVDLAVQTRPDVVVMDLQMPELDGVEATRAVTGALPDAAILVLTMYASDDRVLAAIRSGARGYLLKGSGHGDISRALAAVASGEVVFGPEVASQVLDRLAGVSTGVLDQLTEREREVLTLLAEGLGTNGIAARLYLSPKTVRNHVWSVVGKLGVPDRAQAIAWARRAGLGGPARYA